MSKGRPKQSSELGSFINWTDFTATVPTQDGLKGTRRDS